MFKGHPLPLCVCLQMWLKFIKRRHSSLFFGARGVALYRRRMWMVASWRENNIPWNLILVAGTATWSTEVDPEWAFCCCFTVSLQQTLHIPKASLLVHTALPFSYLVMYLLSVISLCPRSCLAWTTAESDRANLPHLKHCVFIAEHGWVLIEALTVCRVW